MTDEDRATIDAFIARDPDAQRTILLLGVAHVESKRDADGNLVGLRALTLGEVLRARTTDA
jgi:hypothetical protein